MLSIILSDLMNAFEWISHELLIEKFTYCISGPTRNLIRSYLSGRWQFITSNYIKSNVQQNRHGVAQSSLLGLQLFIIYINDLFLFPSSLRYDIVCLWWYLLYLRGNYWKPSSFDDEIEDRAETWSNANKLRDATQKLLTSHSYIRNNSSIKVLGMYTDNFFNSHLCERIFSNICLLGQLKNMRGRDIIDCLLLSNTQANIGIILWG